MLSFCIFPLAAFRSAFRHGNRQAPRFGTFRPFRAITFASGRAHSFLHDSASPAGTGRTPRPRKTVTAVEIAALQGLSQCCSIRSFLAISTQRLERQAMAVNGEFLGGAYIDAIRTRYPALVNDGAIASVDLKLHIGIVQKWSRCANVLGADSPDRFQSLGQRSFSTVHNAWSAAYSNAESETSLRRLGASSSYKGLVLLKPPYDIVLYSNLIWELRPKTIIEFGALQGGSALWFADQLDACGQDGEVHSFELLDKCIHPSASHRRLHFHHADLRRLDTLDERLFARFPHPWLVVD